jgi:hypothetical protein
MPFLDLQRLRALGELRDDAVGGLADQHCDADRHAALAGRAVRRADQRIDGLVEVGVGHHDHVVLRAAERLHALAVARAGLVDVLRDRRRADEAQRLHVGVAEQRIDRDLVALHDIEDAVRQAGLLQQLGHQQRRRRVALARLQHEAVAAGERDRVHPHRDHHREVERRDAGDDTERLAQGPVVDAGRDLVGEVALQQLRDAAGELDDVDPTCDLALRVGEDLAVLGGDHRGQRVAVLLQQLEELQHHASAPQRRQVGPGRKGRARGLHGGIDLFDRGERDLARDVAGRRVVDRLAAPALAGDAAPVDEMTDFGRGGEAFGCAHVLPPM